MECNPCKDCSPEYRGKFAELKALVEAADMIFDRAYEAYGRLTEVSQTERLYEQRDEKI
ncbi:MAG TPA: hypothetical protein VJH04_00975 [archaeon]|nr:hypothetical protein [archaeon]